MSCYFFDSSALVKRYHAESGTLKIKKIFKQDGVSFLISRLTATEVVSVFTKKVRERLMDIYKHDSLCSRFFDDLDKILIVLPIEDAHYVQAEDIISKHGKERSIKTLDALQLSVAISAKQALDNLFFVCTDKALCEIAEKEQLKVINPLEKHESGVL